MLDLGILQVKIKASGDKEVQKKLEEVEKSLDDMKSGFSKAGQGIKDMAAMSAKAITALSAAMTAAVATTQRYREDMAKLETAFKSQNKTVEEAKRSYLDFYGILGESDRSVEAVNHLAELTNNEKELAEWSDIAAGVTAKFGDSLPIEGLTEAANETAKVGSVTGPLADALNWAGISEDGFNEALKACNSTEERATLITNTLTNVYKPLGEQYRELNKDIIAQREAQAELNEIWAEIGATVQPVITELMTTFAEYIQGNLPAIKEAISDVGNAVISFFEAVVDHGNEAVVLISAIGTAFLAWKVGTVIAETITAVKALVKALNTATTSQVALNTAVEANPYVAVAALIMALVGALVSYRAITKDAEDETEKLNKKMEDLEQQTADNIKSIEDKRDAELADIAVTEKMFDRLLELDGELKSNSANTQDNAAKKAELKSLVEQLNAVSPKFQLSLNNETGALNNQSEAVRQLANDYVTLAKAKAYAEAYTEMAKEEIKKGIKLKETREEAWETYVEKRNTADSFNAKGDIGSGKYASARKKELDEEADEAYDTWWNLLDKEYKSGEKTDEYLAKATEYNLEADKITEKYGGDFSGNTTTAYTTPHDNYTPATSTGSSSAGTSSSASIEKAQTAEEIKADFDSYVSDQQDALTREFEAGKITFSDFIAGLINLRDRSYAESSIEFAEMSQIIKSYYDEEVGRQIDELAEQYHYGEITFEEYMEGLTKIATENYTEGTREFQAAMETITTLVKEHTEEEIQKIQTELNKVNLIPTSENESLQNSYQLWLLQNRNATTAEKNAKQTEILNATLKNEIEQRDNLLAAYDKMVEATGENSEESLSLKSSIEKLDISIQETNNSLDDIKNETENTQKQDLYTGYKLRSEMMKLGYTHEAAMKASEAMGYGITINQTFNTPTATPSQVENATKAGIKDMEVKLSQ